MVFSGICPQNDLVEMLELPDHPWFVAVQFHPELKSRPRRAPPALPRVRGRGGGSPARRRREHGLGA